jgi:hypothetical protein
VAVDCGLTDDPPLHSCIKTNVVAQRTNQWWLMMRQLGHPTNFMHLRQYKPVGGVVRHTWSVVLYVSTGALLLYEAVTLVRRNFTCTTRLIAHLTS